MPVQAAPTTLPPMPVPDPAIPTHGVLFDVGYTLLDETDRLNAALAWVAEDLSSRGVPALAGLDTTARFAHLSTQYRNTCCTPSSDPSLFVQMLRTCFGLSEADARDIRRRLPWDAVPLTPYPDAAAALRLLHEAGLKLGVLANQPASAEDDLRRAGLLGYFDHVWLSEAVGLHKPDPAFFRLALSMWSLPPHRVAYVGDRPDNDVAPARRLGMHAVRVRLGPHADQRAEGPEQEAHLVADSLLEAGERLKAWALAAPR